MKSLWVKDANAGEYFIGLRPSCTDQVHSSGAIEHE